MILSKTISHQQIFYIDSEDPVISYLKNGHLYGYHNWLILQSFIIDKSNDAYIVDCGAHIGTFSFVPGIFNNKNMILIDGAIKNTDCLSKTFNGRSNIEIHNKVLLDSERKCSFDLDYGPFGSARSDEEGKLISTTIDSIVNNRKISAIKLDIEGNEPEALVGAKNTLENSKPPLLIEVNGHCLRLNNRKPRDLFDVLDCLEYSYFLIDGKRLIPIDKTEIFPFCVIDIIAIHKSNIYHYSGNYSISMPLSKMQISSILKNAFDDSNPDCQNYFNTLGS